MSSCRSHRFDYRCRYRTTRPRSTHTDCRHPEAHIRAPPLSHSLTPPGLGNTQNIRATPMLTCNRNPETHNIAAFAIATVTRRGPAHHHLLPHLAPLSSHSPTATRKPFRCRIHLPYVNRNSETHLPRRLVLIAPEARTGPATHRLVPIPPPGPVSFNSRLTKLEHTYGSRPSRSHYPLACLIGLSLTRLEARGLD